MRKKSLALLIVLTMLATMFVGVMPASAKSLISVDRVIAIADDFNSTTTGTPVGSTITLQEDSDFPTDWQDGDTFKIVLPSTVKWVTAQTTITHSNPGALVLDTDYFKRTNQVIEVTIPAAASTGGVDSITIAPGIEVVSATGEITLTVEPLDSAMSGGSVAFAVVKSGKTTISVASVPKIGSTGTGGVIEIQENAVAAIGVAAGNTLTLKLPSNFEWNGMAAIDFVPSGGLVGTTFAAPTGNGNRTLNVTFDTSGAAGGARGSIYITPKIRATSDANKGDVSVAISGTNAAGSDIADADIVVAVYTDYGTTASIKEVKELKAGKFGQKTAKITIEENMTGSLIANRDIHVAVPSWVKVTDVTNWAAVNGGGAFNATAAPVPTGKKSYIDITVAGTSTSKGKIEFVMELSIQADKEGDIEATISGAGSTEETLVIGTAIKPAEMTTGSTDVKVGIQDQVVQDIVITEAKKETIALQTYISGAAANDGEITLTLTEGVQFSNTPTVTVTEGNLEVTSSGIALNGDKNVLTIPVKSDSTTASVITVSDVKVTLNRSVPEGAIYVKLGGSAIAENQKAALGWVAGAPVVPAGNVATVDEGEFDVATVVKAQFANVVTPAPGEEKNTASFVIGSTTYLVNGVEQTMDVAPYIKDDRTFMPLRYVAYALGITDANIIWNDVDKTATFSQNSTFVQVKIGSTTMLVNGISINMDVAPEIVDGRTMLPLRWFAQAFGAEVGWDAATNTATIN